MRQTPSIVIRTEDSLETWAKPAIYCVYVENHLILEPSALLGARNEKKYLESRKVQTVFDILLPCAVFKT